MARSRDRLFGDRLLGDSIRCGFFSGVFEDFVRGRRIRMCRRVLVASFLHRQLELPFIEFCIKGGCVANVVRLFLDRLLGHIIEIRFDRFFSQLFGRRRFFNRWFVDSIFVDAHAIIRPRLIKIGGRNRPCETIAERNLHAAKRRRRRRQLTQ